MNEFGNLLKWVIDYLGFAVHQYLLGQTHLVKYGSSLLDWNSLTLTRGATFQIKSVLYRIYTLADSMFLLLSVALKVLSIEYILRAAAKGYLALSIISK